MFEKGNRNRQRNEKKNLSLPETELVIDVIE